MKKHLIITEDLNFVEYPLWVVNSRSDISLYRIDEPHGYYEIVSTNGMPTLLDRVVFNHALGLLFANHELSDNDQDIVELVVTRYKLAQLVFPNKGKVGKKQYERIMKALKRIEGVELNYCGVFYENGRYTHRIFSLIDYVKFDKKTYRLIVHFNQQFIHQVRTSKFSKITKIDTYHALRPVAARLYELLSIAFKHNPRWTIEIKSLAEKLTLKKREYPSHIIEYLIEAVQEINDKFKCNLVMHYDHNTRLCRFVFGKKRVASPCLENTI